MMMVDEEDDIISKIIKKSRSVYERPDNLKSTWWIMLEKGDCKNPPSPQ
jgi:hypothetical protein